MHRTLHAQLEDSGLGKRFGGCFMFLCGLFAFARWLIYGELFFLLFCLKDTMTAYFFFKRKKSLIQSSSGLAVVAYASTAFPFFYFPSSNGLETPFMYLMANLFTITGFSIAAWAVIDLGDKFGISPAKRGDKCVQGIYRIISHPMYWGYAIAQLGWIFINPLNIPLYIFSMILFMIRAKSETKTLVRDIIKRNKRR